MGLEGGWRHARKRRSLELEDLKKNQLGVEIGPWKTRVEVEGWDWAFEDIVNFFGFQPREILNITRCVARWEWLT